MGSFFSFAPNGDRGADFDIVAPRVNRQLGQVFVGAVAEVHGAAGEKQSVDRAALVPAGEQVQLHELDRAERRRGVPARAVQRKLDAVCVVADSGLNLRENGDLLPLVPFDGGEVQIDRVLPLFVHNGGEQQLAALALARERGVELRVVGVEVVHHDAVGLLPLVELVVGGMVACHKISSISYVP